ncbi:glycosyltransferase [Candidimonas nitroreducens]|uniref:Amylovoran biosynthesis protein AmsE n=1 Tax=Candidimonas nitroreducens TaxID=683354 RepID=A0A225MRD8_9BURK|nr:glycosyltransferase [Candidimonas nitroreducens]OWT63854.1 amylovoran biosynthesis protein AmsE [Candidimonas nitroreducens]
MRPKFSVLMAVYFKDDPAYLRQALASIEKNTVLPDEIVLVEDGPIGLHLREVIDEFRSHLNIKSISLVKNQGLGLALNVGLTKCIHEWVARFDADDVCIPERFEAQLRYIGEHPHVGVFGAQVLEFDSDTREHHKSKRPLACEHNDIVKFAKSRNPFNHMTVMFKKSAVQAAGGYQSDYLYEDYCLWVRMILSGIRTGNINIPLVYARAGENMYRRRGGWAYVKGEFRAQLKFLQWNFITPLLFVRNIIVRIPVRLAPQGVRSRIYKRLLRMKA